MFISFTQPVRVITIALLGIAAWLLYGGSTVPAPVEPPVAEEALDNFHAYGFNYIRVRNVHTDKSIYLIADHVVEHCCGDMGQLAKLTLAGNAIAREYIGFNMDAPLSDYNLQPVFSKCLQTEAYAEEIRQKKLQFFNRLGYTVVELPMKLGMAGSCSAEKE